VAGKTVLVVGEPAGVAHLASVTLETLGYRVRHAADSQQALAAMSRGLPDLALVEANLSRLAGLACAARLRERGVATIVLIPPALAAPGTRAGTVRQVLQDPPLLLCVTGSLDATCLLGCVAELRAAAPQRRRVFDGLPYATISQDVA
jgi:CheY-like chemotaxis protein